MKNLNTKQQDIIESFKNIISRMQNFTNDEIIETWNEVKLLMHENSPLSTEPVDCVLWVKNETVYANDYNPN